MIAKPGLEAGPDRPLGEAELCYTRRTRKPQDATLTVASELGLVTPRPA